MVSSPRSLPPINRVGIIVISTTWVAFVTMGVKGLVAGDASPDVVLAFGIMVAYALGLTWGWWQIRPRGRASTGYTLALVPVLGQLVSYALFWGGCALDVPTRRFASGSLGEWVSAAALLSFLLLGPVAGVVAMIASRRAVPLLAAEMSGPLIFFCTMP